MNRYLEKAASLFKVAFDGDYDEGGEYGICANRPISSNNVYASLRAAIKDPNVVVDVDGVKSSRHPEKLHKLLNDMEKSYVHEGKPYWPRSSGWSIGMQKRNPLLQKYIGKEDHLGWEITDPEGAIAHYIHSKFKP